MYSFLLRDNIVGDKIIISEMIFKSMSDLLMFLMEHFTEIELIQKNQNMVKVKFIRSIDSQIEAEIIEIIKFDKWFQKFKNLQILK